MPIAQPMRQKKYRPKLAGERQLEADLTDFIKEIPSMRRVTGPDRTQ